MVSITIPKKGGSKYGAVATVVSGEAGRKND
jgi:hypothetical protein